MAEAEASDGGHLGGQCRPIEVQKFSNRLNIFYDHWELFHKHSDVILLQTPPIYSGNRVLMSSIFCVWLYGVEFPDTMFLFTKKIIYILSSEYNRGLFEIMEEATKISTRGLTLKLYDISKPGGVNRQIQKMFLQINPTGKSTITVGYIKPSSFFHTWNQKSHLSYLEVTDVTAEFSELFVVKDRCALSYIKQSAFLNYVVMDDWVVKVLRDIVITNGRPSHSLLIRNLMKTILKPKLLRIPTLDQKRINICHPPVIKSGDNFDFKSCVESNDKVLVYESGSVIVCIISSSYNDHCSYIARTFLIRPSSLQTYVYNILLEAQNTVIQTLVPGTKLSDAYKAGRSVVERRDPGLLPFLTESAGMGIGLEFSESNLNLDARNDRTVKSGMAFKVILGFEHVKKENDRTFSMLLGDTVIVDGNPRCTTLSRKELNYVTHPFFKNEG